MQGREAKDSNDKSYNLTKHNKTQPGGELLLGLFTLLTTHHVYGEGYERKSNRKRLNNPAAVSNNPKQLMHRVYYALLTSFPAGEREGNGEQLHSAKKSLSVLNNPMLALRRGKHEQALTFLIYREKE